MTWSTGRPIFNRLPVPYQNSEPTDWFTIPWDELLLEAKAEGDNFYTNYLDPDNARASVLDWLAQFCGFTGEYWDSSWSEDTKRLLIRESYSRIWPQKGSRDLLDWLLQAFEIQAALFIPGEFLAGVNVAGDTLGAATGLEYYIRMALQYTRQSTTWNTAVNLNNLYGPVFAKSRLMYDMFYAGVSVAGDLVFSVPLFEDLAVVLSEPFTLPAGLEVLRVGFDYRTNLEPTNYEFVTDITYHVNGETGDDANDGSLATPFQTFRHALETLESSVNTSGTIEVASGVYRNDWINTRTSKNLVVKGSSVSRPIFRVDSFQTWTLESGNVWSANKDSGPALTHCFDLSRPSGSIMPVMLNSIAEVIATPGSQYLAMDETLYVHLADGRAPDNDVKPSYAIEAGGVGDDRSAIDGANLTIYIENVIFEGGNLAFTVNGTAQDATLYNCIFRYSSGDGFAFLPPDETVDTSGIFRFFSCEASENLGSGFDFTGALSNCTSVLEDCITFGNRDDGLSLDTLTVISISGSYRNSSAFNVSTNASASLWTVGDIAQNSGAGADIKVFSGASAWLYGVNTQGSSATYGLEADTGATAVLQDLNSLHSVLIN